MDHFGPSYVWLHKPNDNIIQTPFSIEWGQI